MNLNQAQILSQTIVDHLAPHCARIEVAGSIPELELQDVALTGKKDDGFVHCGEAESGLTGLDSRNVRFYAEIIFRNHIYNTLD